MTSFPLFAYNLRKIIMIVLRTENVFTIVIYYKKTFQQQKQKKDSDHQIMLDIIFNPNK